MIEALGVWKRYEAHDALRGVSLAVERGEVVAVIGPSGSGKSTLLRCLNGLETISAGTVVVDGQVLQDAAARPAGRRERREQRRRARAVRAELGMVFQRFNLFAHMTALENVIEAPMRVRGLSREAATRQAGALLERVQLAHRAHHYPEHLSGGEQQRVAIARALAMEPKAMLFDEATSALDPETVGEVLGVMRRLAQDGMTMVIVTHEMQFARAVADRVLVMDEGQIIDEGPASAVLGNPRHPRTRDFLARVLEMEDVA